MAQAMRRANLGESYSSPARQEFLRDPSGAADEVATTDAAFGPGYWLPRCDGFSLLVAGERCRVGHAAVTAQGRAKVWVRFHEQLVCVDADIDSVRTDPVARLVKIECFH